MRQFLKSAIAQQCLGAAVGATLAYMLYVSGTWAVGKFEAMLVPAATKAEITESVREDRMERIGATAKAGVEGQ